MLTIVCVLLLTQDAANNRSEFETQHRLGESYIQKKDYAAAVPHLRAAYRLDPTSYNNAFDLAQAQLQAGDPAAARTVARDLLARGERPELRHLLGECEEAAGNLREAIKQYQLAARADETEQNLFSFGSALLRANAPSEAKSIFSYASGRFTGSARIQVGLGVAQYAASEYPQAVETLCRAVDMDPKDTRALEFLGKMSGVAPGLAQEVSTRLRHFATTYPSNAAANYYYAMSLRAAAKETSPDSAEMYLERAVKESPSFAEAHYELGLVKEERGDNRSAVEEYELAIRLRHNLRSAHYRLAKLYRSAGRTREAEREFAIVRTLPSGNQK